ncbi:hypothetical protein Kpol_1018p91 [Vanderwaltozyma polyspora DSM 70294]|uniref:Activator of C kinase protein 1 n=1 Tax=Vanderwaltozyma polyspora (strain ATCC 22028 / DSM 70294 / BCRC 21397 / CBS 2163 / NBRC 10782 / NRRL Y-8283 / UCD 57-17) TaxID=436907 RepID=A7TDT8_VANPO|nr:uncharacterized protein Kpol_1018p91 [Vanderwaltozyma polyspora DSM 70294]EDO19558.1 hypothetical protein Kpol_1018p91 [Vanderwaltozyma polyspora DSM 70294]
MSQQQEFQEDISNTMMVKFGVTNEEKAALKSSLSLPELFSDNDNIEEDDNDQISILSLPTNYKIPEPDINNTAQESINNNDNNKNDNNNNNSIIDTNMEIQISRNTSQINDNNGYNINSKTSSIFHYASSDDVRSFVTVSSLTEKNKERTFSDRTSKKPFTLLPDMSVIEMYRKHSKKQNNPNVLFQYAQDMMNTAISINEDTGIENYEYLKEQFFKESRYYLRYLSYRGYLEAQYYLADAYSSGVYGSVNNKKAFKMFRHAAKHGHVECAFRTACCYEMGISVKKSTLKAIDYLKFAASKNHPASMFKLGMYLYYEDIGITKDIDSKLIGVNWLTRAATVANNEILSQAPYELAKIFEVGYKDLIIPDEKYSTELYIQAASLGNISAASTLGQIYEEGKEEIGRNPELSLKYYEQAAAGGNSRGMYGLGCYYLTGLRPYLRKDLDIGFKWVASAAKRNLAQAQYLLGYLYEKGKGCEKSIDLSVSWYQKSAKNGYDLAIEKLKSISPDKDLDSTQRRKRFSILNNGILSRRKSLFKFITLSRSPKLPTSSTLPELDSQISLSSGFTSYVSSTLTNSVPSMEQSFSSVEVTNNAVVTHTTRPILTSKPMAPVG